MGFFRAKPLPTIEGARDARARLDPLLEALTTFGGDERFHADLLQARKHYFSSVGEIFEDDKSFGARMACFFDYFVYDWPLASDGKTVSQLFVEEGGG